MKIFHYINELPSIVRYKGKIYKGGPGYANMETARREAEHLRALKGLKVLMRKYYIQPSRPYAYYVLYIKAV